MSSNPESPKEETSIEDAYRYELLSQRLSRIARRMDELQKEKDRLLPEFEALKAKGVKPFENIIDTTEPNITSFQI